MSVQEIVQPELDYRQITTSVPTYRYRQYVPENGATIALQNSTRVLDVFRFGAGFVCNLSKTRLMFSVTHTIGANTLLCLYPELQIAAIRLETDNGVVLLDQQNWHAVNKVIRMPNKTLDDVHRCTQFGTLEDHLLGSPVAPANYNSSTLVALTIGAAMWDSVHNTKLGSAYIDTGLWNRARSGIPITPGDLTKVTTAYPITFLKNMRKYDDNKTVPFEFNIQCTNYREADSFVPLIVIPAKASTGEMFFDVKLGDAFPHTVLQQAQDMWFGGHSLVLSIWWQPINNWGFSCTYTGAADAVTFPADTTTIVSASAATNLGTITAATGTHVAFSTYPHLLVACQDSPSIVAAVQQQILGPGLTLPVQHMEFVRIATAAATQTRTAPLKYYQTFKLSLAQGSTLLRAYHAFSRADDAMNVDEIGNPPNWDNCSLVDFRAYVNAQPLTDSLQDLWEIYQTRRKIYDSCQLKGMDSSWMYYGCPVINDFTGFADMMKTTPSSGLSLQAPTDYQIECDITGDAKNAVSVFVFLRFLRLSSAGVSLTSA